MFKVFSVFVSFSILVVSATLSYGQTTPQMNLKNSGSMGYIPTTTRAITSNETFDLSVTTVTLDENRNLSALGCGALDNHQARLSILREDNTRLDEYFSTPVSNYMVTTLFNSPAVAQIFNGLENFSGSRVRELQDRCAAMEYKDDLAPAQWAAVQSCIDSVVAANSDDTAPEVMADAFKYCLSSPDYVVHGGDDATAGKTLQDSAKEILESAKWNGTLFSALQHTRACESDGAGGSNCAIFTFLPNVRWCSLTNKVSFNECAEENAGDPTTGGASGETIISPEAVSPMQIFDAAFGHSEGFTTYAKVYAAKLIEKIGAHAQILAMEGENKYALLHSSNVATKDDVMNNNLTPSGSATYGDVGMGTDFGPIALTGVNGLNESLGLFLNCDISGGAIEWEDFNQIVNDATITALMPAPMTDATYYGDTFHRDMGISHSQSSDSSIPASVFTSAGGINLIETATKCTMHNELRLSLSDYLGLYYQDASRDAALLGYRTQVAYASTRSLLRFIINRLELAKLDLALNVSTDPNSPPPHVRLAVDTIIKSFESRLLEMEGRRKQQRDYADIIARFQR